MADEKAPDTATPRRRSEYLPEDIKIESSKFIDYGRLDFPTSKRAVPAKWARITGDGDSRTTLAGLCKLWRLPMPSVIISVAGTAADSVSLNEKQKLVFRRGLLSVCRTTDAGGDEDETAKSQVPWVVTAGLNSGVAELVGRCMKEEEEVRVRERPDATPIPCIGIAPWGVVAQRHKMSAESADGGGSAGPSVRASPARRRARFGRRYVYQPPGGSNKFAKAEPFDDRPLDNNHSHFVLVESESGLAGEVALGSEIPTRANLMEAVTSTIFGVDEDNDPLPTPPYVCIVIGGGEGTLQIVLRTLRDSRPVVCLADSGGAAKAIYQYVQSDGRILETADEASARYLPEIKRLGETEQGANRVRQLTFYSTETDVLASNDLAKCILTAILSDCEQTVDAINFAVRAGAITAITIATDTPPEYGRCAGAIQPSSVRSSTSRRTRTPAGLPRRSSTRSSAAMPP